MIFAIVLQWAKRRAELRWPDRTVTLTIAEYEHTTGRVFKSSVFNPSVFT